MRTLRLSGVGVIMLALLATSAAHTATPARAAEADAPVFHTPGVEPGLTWGPGARAAFDGLASDGVVTFVDFEDTPTGLHHRLQLGDIAVRLRTTQLRWPLPERRAPARAPVAVLPYDFVKEPADHRLMGVTTVKLGDGKYKFVPDGQSRFELALFPPVSHIGLYRPWNTYSLTRFYDEDGALLAEHRNTVDHEFVGYVAARPEDRVRRIVFDAIPETPDDEYNHLFQVGSVDDLFLGNGPAGVSDASAVLPPLDPRIGVTDAGAPPGPTDGDASTDGSAEPGPAAWPEQILSGEGYVAVAKLLWGIALNEQLSEDTRAEAQSLALLLYLLMSPDAPAEDTVAIDLDAPDDTPVEPPQSAFDAMADGIDAGPGTFVGAPPDLKPAQTKRMQDQGRVWVQLPAAATIDAGKSTKQEQTLKTKTWYQVKLDPVGTQVFYDRKGKLLGRNLSPDPVQVRVWVAQEEEQ